MIVGMLEPRVFAPTMWPPPFKPAEPLDCGDDSVLLLLPLLDSGLLFGLGGSAGRDLSNISKTPLMAPLSFV